MRCIRGLAAFVASLPLLAFASISVEDDAGARLLFDAPVQRIVTLAPHLAELVFEAGVGERLVGTVEWSDYPAAANRVPRVGDGFRIDAERIVALRPDLVLAWGGGTPRATIEQLRALDMPVAVLVPRTLESIPRHLEFIGRVTGQSALAQRKAGAFRAGLEALRERYASREPVTVFYQVNDPLLFTIGGDHFITEAIETCGGRNIFAALSSGAHAISREQVIARNPDAIVIGSYDEALYDAANWTPWHGMTAVRTGNVFVVDAALLTRAAPRIMDGIRQLCRRLEAARRKAG